MARQWRTWRGRGGLRYVSISYATDDALVSALRPPGYTMRLIKESGQGYHHTFAVLYDNYRVKLDPVKALEDAAQRPLRDGERVILWEPGLEVEASLIYGSATDSWLARPDGATWRDVPLEPDQLSGEVKQGHA